MLQSPLAGADSLLSSHSMRIGGATDFLSAGANFSAGERPQRQRGATPKHEILPQDPTPPRVKLGAAGLQAGRCSFSSQALDHPFVFIRGCAGGTSVASSWLEVPEDATRAPSPPYPLHSRPEAEFMSAKMSKSFSARDPEHDADAIFLPVCTARVGAPSLGTTDAFGASILPQLMQQLVFDEHNRVIQWPWERGAESQQPWRNWSTALGPDPAAAFFVDTKPAPGGKAVSHLDATVLEGLRAATAAGDGGENSTGVRAWKRFCGQHGRAADRPIDPVAPLWVKLDEEQWVMRFVAHLVDSRDIQVDTAKTYFHQASGWHQRKHGIPFAGGLDLKRLPEMVKGLRRTRDTVRPQRIRRGVAPQKLKEALDKLFPRGTSAYNANVRTMVSLAFQALLRGREVCKADGKDFDRTLDLVRGDIAAMLADRVVIMIRPAKNMRHRKGKTVPIAVGAGGHYVDAHAELAELLKLDPVAQGAAASTPMFRRPDGAAFSVADLRDIVKALMRAVGEDPDQFGAHSLRIGGATALYAAGADPIHIKTMGRWSSDCWRIYVRACFEQTLSWTQRAGSQAVHDMAGGVVDVVAEVDAIFGTDDA